MSDPETWLWPDEASQDDGYATSGAAPMSETMTDTAVLREAAEKATGFHDGNLVRYEHGGGRLAIIPVPGDGPRKLIADFYHEEDREFFVLCDPATILSLCDEIDRLRTEADVRVTALEWSVNGADTGLGSLYYVRHYDDGTWGWHLTMGPDVPDRYSSPGEAKAAAQADYETRIRAALQGGDNE